MAGTLICHQVVVVVMVAAEDLTPQSFQLWVLLWLSAPPLLLLLLLLSEMAAVSLEAGSHAGKGTLGHWKQVFPEDALGGGGVTCLWAPPGLWCCTALGLPALPGADCPHGGGCRSKDEGEEACQPGPSPAEAALGCRHPALSSPSSAGRQGTGTVRMARLESPLTLVGLCVQGAVHKWACHLWGGASPHCCALWPVLTLAPDRSACLSCVWSLFDRKGLFP